MSALIYRHCAGKHVQGGCRACSGSRRAKLRLRVRGETSPGKLITCKGCISAHQRKMHWPAAGLWVDVWAQLLRDIAADPPSQQRVMVDILNEPDSRGLACVFWPGQARHSALSAAGPRMHACTRRMSCHALRGDAAGPGRSCHLRA